MQGGDTMAMINAIWPFILMGGIFYFMLYRPQKQEQQKRQRMLDSLKKGDKVAFYGEYEWSEQGGVIHWTHHDPSGRHTDGWLKHDGRLYQ